MIFSSWNGRSTTSSSMYAPMNAADATFLDDWSMLTIAACSVALHAREPLRCTIGHILAAGDSAHGRRLCEQTCCGWFRSAMACPPRAAPRRRPCLVGTRAGGNYPGKYRAVPGRIPRRVGCAVPCRVGYLDKRERNVLEPVLRAEEIQSEALQRIVCVEMAVLHQPCGLGQPFIHAAHEVELVHDRARVHQRKDCSNRTCHATE